MIKHLDTFTCYYMNGDTEEKHATLEEALDAAARYCGNRSYARPFPKEHTYLFGPGDGTTTVLVRQDIELKFTRIVDGKEVE